MHLLGLLSGPMSAKDWYRDGETSIHDLHLYKRKADLRRPRPTKDCADRAPRELLRQTPTCTSDLHSCSVVAAAGVPRRPGGSWQFTILACSAARLHQALRI